MLIWAGKRRWVGGQRNEPQRNLMSEYHETVKVKDSKYGNMFTNIETWFYIWKLFMNGTMTSNLS